MVTQTRRVDDQDLDQCANVLGEAFNDYAWTRWTVDPIDHRRRIIGLQRLALEHVLLVGGEVWATTVDGAVRSVIAWNDSHGSAGHAVDDGLATAIAQLEGSRHDVSLAAERQAAIWRPVGRYLFLGVVGTDPSVQRCGLGTRTVEPLLAAADLADLDVYLETSSETNVKWYSTFGFRVVGHFQVVGGGPLVWTMLRAPTRNAGAQ